MREERMANREKGGLIVRDLVGEGVMWEEFECVCREEMMMPKWEKGVLIVRRDW